MNNQQIKDEAKAYVKEHTPIFAVAEEYMLTAFIAGAQHMHDKLNEPTAYDDVCEGPTVRVKVPSTMEEFDALAAEPPKPERHTRYYTFGQGHEHYVLDTWFNRNVVVKITSRDPRTLMCALFGSKWSFEYDTDPTQSGCYTDLVDLNTLLYL